MVPVAYHLNKWDHTEKICFLFVNPQYVMISDMETMVTFIFLFPFSMRTNSLREDITLEGLSLTGEQTTKHKSCFQILFELW